MALNFGTNPYCWLGVLRFCDDNFLMKTLRKEDSRAVSLVVIGQYNQIAASVFHFKAMNLFFFF